MKEGLNSDMKFCVKIPQLIPCYKSPLPREGIHTLFQSSNIKIRLSLHKTFFSISKSYSTLFLFFFKGKRMKYKCKPTVYILFQEVFCHCNIIQCNRLPINCKSSFKPLSAKIVFKAKSPTLPLKGTRTTAGIF